ncbi:MAG: hypothetical protein PHO91_02870 [Patescibacteria group bacterium]|nr:hypothetical protein [Patescibacteria group bacterium]
MISQRAPIIYENSKSGDNIPLVAALAYLLAYLPSVSQVTVCETYKPLISKRKIELVKTMNELRLTIYLDDQEQTIQIRGNNCSTNDETFSQDIVSCLTDQKKHLQTRKLKITGLALPNTTKTAAPKKPQKEAIVMTSTVPPPPLLSATETLAYQALIAIINANGGWKKREVVIRQLGPQIKAWAKENNQSHNTCRVGLEGLRDKGLVIGLPEGSVKPKSFLVKKIDSLTMPNNTDKQNNSPSRAAVSGSKPIPPEAIKTSLKDALAELADILQLASDKIRLVGRMLP